MLGEKSKNSAIAPNTVKKVPMSLVTLFHSTSRSLCMSTFRLLLIIGSLGVVGGSSDKLVVAFCFRRAARLW